MVDTNALGDRGETIFIMAASQFHGEKPLFRLAHLGGKWPVADFAVELYDSPGRMFLVQVKATRIPVKRGGKIPVNMDEERVRLLMSAPMPTYVAAVDERKKRVYLIRPVSGKRIQSVETTYSLNDPAIREKLRDEVDTFWRDVQAVRANSTSFFLES